MYSKHLDVQYITGTQTPALTELTNTTHRDLYALNPFNCGRLS